MFREPRSPEVAQQKCEVCGRPSSAWFSRIRFCSRCLEGASQARDAVPLPNPPATSPSDIRVREFQRAQDLAVSEWVDQQQSQRRNA